MGGKCKKEHRNVQDTVKELAYAKKEGEGGVIVIHEEINYKN